MKASRPRLISHLADVQTEAQRKEVPFGVPHHQVPGSTGVRTQPPAPNTTDLPMSLSVPFQKEKKDGGTDSPVKSMKRSYPPKPAGF